MKEVAYFAPTCYFETLKFMSEWEQVGKTKRFSAYPGFGKLNLKMSFSFSLNRKNSTCAKFKFYSSILFCPLLFLSKRKIENSWFRIDNILKNKWKLTWHFKNFFFQNATILIGEMSNLINPTFFSIFENQNCIFIYQFLR